MKDLIILAKDRIGLLADITYILGSARINIDAINATAVDNNAIIFLSVKNDKKAKELLEKNGFKVLAQNNLIIRLKNVPGEMSKVARMLSDNKVNILSVILIGTEKDYQTYAIAVERVRKAKQLLKDYLHEEK
ncbi:MAG: ACT domain-containing protein [Candidatus Micrarchaeota archaeon]|nr:ACT domain-containing protein [Candidatus Micrarchaeota archaeon]